MDGGNYQWSMRASRFNRIRIEKEEFIGESFEFNVNNTEKVSLTIYNSLYRARMVEGLNT